MRTGLGDGKGFLSLSHELGRNHAELASLPVKGFSGNPSHGLEGSSSAQGPERRSHPESWRKECQRLLLFLPQRGPPYLESSRLVSISIDKNARY